MITVENSQTAFVGLPGGVEVGLTNAGRWTFGEVLYVSGGTNAQVHFGGTNFVLRDGAVILVDSGAVVTVVNGPDMLGSAEYAFWCTMIALAPILIVRYLVKRFAGWAGLPTPGGV